MNNEKVYEEVVAEVQKVEESILSLEDERERTLGKISKLQTIYENGIESEALGEKAFKEGTKIRNEIDKLSDDIKQIDEKLVILNEVKKTRGKELAERVRELRDNALDNLDNEWEEHFKDLNRKKAEYILALSNQRELKEKGRLLISEGNRVLRLLGEKEDIYKTYKSTSEIPIDLAPRGIRGGDEDTTLYNSLTIPAWAIRRIYLEGKVPKWVKNIR